MISYPLISHTDRKALITYSNDLLLNSSNLDIPAFISSVDRGLYKAAANGIHDSVTFSRIRIMRQEANYLPHV